jgi:hypothetical protein
MRGFPQADLNEAASAADAFACLLRRGGRGDLSWFVLQRRNSL